MKTTLRLCLSLTIAAAALLTLTGCNTISVQSQQYVGVPTYPPTLPADVQVMRTEPTRPNVRLGQITLEPASESTPVANIEAKIQQVAAKMGANAVVIVVDRTQVTGAMVVGGWADRSVVQTMGRVIVGIPIRYTQ